MAGEDWSAGEIEVLDFLADLTGKTLGEAEHRAMHDRVSTLLTKIQFATVVEAPWTPVLHTDGSPDFARGNGNDVDHPVAGMSVGGYTRIGNFVFGWGSIRCGLTGFNVGNGFYHVTLPVPCAVSPARAKPIGSATIGFPGLLHDRMGLHQGQVSNHLNKSAAFFTYTNETLMWNTLDGFRPLFEAQGGDVHIEFHYATDE